MVSAAKLSVASTSRHEGYLHSNPNRSESRALLETLFPDVG